MSAMRGTLVNIWHKLPLPAGLRQRLGGLIRKFLGRAEVIGVVTSTQGSQNREWVHATMVANLKDRVAFLEERLAKFGRDAELHTQSQRARDVDIYLRLGGRVPQPAHNL